MDIDKLLRGVRVLASSSEMRDGEVASTRMVGAAAEKLSQIVSERSIDYIDTQLTPELERAVRTETSRLVSMANKRLRRLEEAGLEKTPAYRNWMKWEDGQNFGIRGKDYGEVVDEYNRLEKFVEHETSSVRGATSYLKELGDTIGLKYDDRVDIQDYAGKVFEITSKIDQYMRTTGEGHAIGTEVLLRYVSEFTQDPSLGVNILEELDVDTIVEMLSNEDIQGDVRRNMHEYVYQEEGLGDELESDWMKLM